MVNTRWLLFVVRDLGEFSCKKWMCLLVLFWGANTGLSQPVVREYFDRRGEKCSSDSSYYYSLGKKNNRGFFYDSLKSYYTKSNRVKTIELRDQYGNRMGSCESYYESGRLKSRSRYDKKMFRIFDTNPDSTEYLILDFADSLGHFQVKNGEGFVNGRLDFLMEQGKVLHGLRDSVWILYYDDGKVYSYESWEAGQLIDGLSYDETGKEHYFSKLLVLPEPKTGLTEFCDDLGTKITYPRNAEKRGIEGKIVIDFWVEKDGSITAPHVCKGIGFGCDEEAIKALITSPHWVPCKKRGQPVRYKMTIPFLFKLS
jgi:TonB family protein